MLFRDSAAALAANGYRPVPIRPRSKAPIPNDWPHYTYFPGDEAKFGDAGTGTLCGELVPADVDVRDPALAQAIEQIIMQAFGSAPRRIGNAPKVALFYRTDKPFRKLRSVFVRLPGDAPGSKPHGVEILGVGQQIVVNGTHPDTRNDYTWNGAGDLLEVPLAQLNTVSEAECFNVLQRISELLLAHGTATGAIAQRDASDPIIDAEREAFNRDECAQAIAAIANAERHYDDWVYIGMAIKGALGEAGKAAWHAFSAKAEKYNHDATERAWRSFAPTSIGAGTLYRLAFAAGWNRPTYDVDLSGLLGVKADESPIVDAGRFMADWTPTEYVLKGILIRGYLHALTGHSNAGKTAIALKMAVCVAMGLPFGNHPTTRARAVYLAGENPDDVRSRVIALCQDMRINADDLAQWFFVLPRAYSLDAHRQATIDAIAKLGPVGVVVIDTRAAYAGAEDENDNAQTMADAQAARALTALPGRPCVLVPNHPPHGATAPNMRPRGGSSYYGEIDINFNVSNDGAGGVTLVGEKMRGAAHFEPITMALRVYTLLGYAQPDGDAVTAVVVDVTTPEQADEIAAETESDENRLLVIMAHNADSGLRDWAAQMGWPNGKNKLSRLLASLAEDKLVRRYRRRWTLTNAGEKEGAAAIARGLKSGRDRAKRSAKDVPHDD